jgi:hypothetical protein
MQARRGEEKFAPKRALNPLGSKAGKRGAER